MASQTLPPGQYPAQVVFMATDELADSIGREARRSRVSKSQVAREWIEAGREAADVAVEWGVEVRDVLDAARVRLDELAGADKATTRRVES